MITDKMMEEAAEELFQAMLAGLPEEEQCVHQFSERFERKMKRLIRRAEHPVFHRVLQQAASIVLVLFLGFATLLAVSPTVRAAVFGWVQERYEDLTTYYFDGASQQDTKPVDYEIGNLTEEFAELYRDVKEKETTIYYHNAETNQVMSFSYYHECSIYTHNVVMEDAIIEKITVNGYEADFYCCNDEMKSNAIVWIDSSTDTLFSIVAFMDKEELISLAESVIVCE